MKFLYHNLNIKLLLIIIFLSLNTSCTGRISNHGTLNIDKIINSVVERKLEKAEIEALLGPPSTTSAFEFNKWYYIKTTLIHKALKKPEIKEHIVYEIIFNKENQAIKINKYNKDDINEISYNKEFTETKGNKKSLLQLIVKDLLKADLSNN